MIFVFYRKLFDFLADKWENKYTFINYKHMPRKKIIKKVDLDNYQHKSNKRVNN